MPKLSLLSALVTGAIIGGVLSLALVEQQPNPAVVAQGQSAEAIGLVSEICERIDLSASLQRSNLTEVQFDNANMLVSEVCNQFGPQPERRPVQRATSTLDDTGRPTQFAVYEGV